MEWSKKQYNEKYETWMPWIQDNFLYYFTKDNKASYATREQLDKSKVTGIQQVDTLQDGVNNLAAGQVGQGGLLQPVGDAVSKEGVNRSQRGGKDDKGGYLPSGMPGFSKSEGKKEDESGYLPKNIPGFSKGEEKKGEEKQSEGGYLPKNIPVVGGLSK